MKAERRRKQAAHARVRDIKYICIYGVLLMLFVSWLHRAVTLRNVSELKTNATGNVNYSTLTDKCTEATVMATLLRYANAVLPNLSPQLASVVFALVTVIVVVCRE